MKILFCLLTIGVFLLVLDTKDTNAQPEPAAESSNHAVSVCLPGIFFKDAVTKADFLTHLEESIGKALDKPVLASFKANTKYMKDDSIWLVDGIELASHPNLKIAQQAFQGNSSTLPVSVYTRKKWKSAHTVLSKGKVVIPEESDKQQSVFQYVLLLDEPNARNMSKRFKVVRDVRSALTTVAAGEADAAVVFKANYQDLDPRLSALVEQTWLQELPLPALAVNTSKFTDKTERENLIQALKKAKLPVISGMVSTWKYSVSSKSHKAYSDALARKRSWVSRYFTVADLPTFKTDATTLLPKAPIAIPLNPTLVFPEKENQPLPDPPRPGEEENEEKKSDGTLVGLR